jgi:hypothetical protein
VASSGRLICLSEEDREGPAFIDLSFTEVSWIARAPPLLIAAFIYKTSRGQNSALPTGELWARITWEF